MNKDIKKNKSIYHQDGRNNIEKFIISMLPKVLEAYGLSKTSFYFKTEDDNAPVGDVMFTISYKGSYKTAFIDINRLAVDYYEAGEKQTILNGLVHEVGHIITDRLAEVALSRHSTKKEIRDSVEEATETIAQIVRTLLSKMDPKNFKD